MSKELIISCTSHETKIAVLEEDQVVEIYFERGKEYSLAGSIYKGRVTRVLPGMQSAFVDVGLERDAFLYVSDFLEDTEEYDRIASTVEDTVSRMDEKAAGEIPPGPPVRVAIAEGPPAEVPAPREPSATATPSRDIATEKASPGNANVAGPPRPPGSDKAAPPADSRQRFSRHSRRRRPHHKGFPDSKYARQPGAGPVSAAPVAPSAPTVPYVSPAASEPPATPIILPGESLAKYKDWTQRSSAAPPDEVPQKTVRTDLKESQETSSGTFRSGASIPELSAEESAATSREPHEALPSASGSNPGSEAASEKDDTQKDEPRHEPPSSPVLADAIVTEFRSQAQIESVQMGTAPLAIAPTVEAAAMEIAPIEEQSQAPAQREEEPYPPRIEESSSFPDESLAQVPDAAVPDAPEFAAPADAPSVAAEDAPEFGAAESSVEVDTKEDGSDTGTAPNEPLEGSGTEAGMPQKAAVRERPRNPRYMRRGRWSGRKEVREEGVQPGSRPREREIAPQPLIADMLKEGQEILVQIAKEPLGKKGARITSHIAFPGRYLVYMPTVDHVGVSRKIPSDAERQRLKRIILDNSKGIQGGFIVRTAGEGHSEEDFRQDILYLSKLWAEIKAQAEKSSAPILLHHDLNLVLRTLRDQLSEEFSSVWVDNEQEYEKILSLVNKIQPAFVNRIKMYTKDIPLFDELGIQEEINKDLKTKVWLKSGGYIVINQTEALVAIDVNTGKFVGKSNRLEDTIVKTNVEAIREIVRQIRLRDLGGIIVVDFIDMDEKKNRQKVMAAMEEALRSDRAPSKILSFNEFGLVAITR